MIWIKNNKQYYTIIFVLYNNFIVYIETVSLKNITIVENFALVYFTYAKKNPVNFCKTYQVNFNIFFVHSSQYISEMHFLNIIFKKIKGSFTKSDVLND